MFFIFAFAGVILSCSLLVQSNNIKYYQAQMIKDAEAHLVDLDEDADEDEEDSIFGVMGKVMTIFALGAILIVAWGCTSMLFFHSISMKKSYAMMQIFGMQKKDVFGKALVDGIFFGFTGSLAGDMGGYMLFRYLTKKLSGADALIPMISREMLFVLFMVMLVLVIISFFGSLISGLYVYETPIITMLFERKGEKGRQTYLKFGIIEFAILYLLILAMFYKNIKFINVALLICGIILFVLYVCFYIAFHDKKKKRDTQMKPLIKIRGISYRFLCTRNKRDALLAATVSVGAVIICIALSIVFDFENMVRRSYRDSMGYSTIVWVKNKLYENGRIQEILDKNGYKYTKVFYKEMFYMDLNADIKPTQNKDDFDYFWAAVVDSQTDDNKHFKLEEGTYKAENYFCYRTGTDLREYTDIFGKELKMTQRNFDNVPFSIMGYHVVVNRCDWGLGLDDTWDTGYLLDMTEEEEKNLLSFMEGEDCEIATASAYVHEFIRLLSDYLSVVAVTGVMLLLVTATFFYSMVRGDLQARRKELYLYQMYGASRQKAFWVVHLEYLMIAGISSITVLVTSFFMGEAAFTYLLRENYPMSIPVMAGTSLAVMLFVLACCYAAQWVNYFDSKMEIIRDE